MQAKTGLMPTIIVDNDYLGFEHPLSFLWEDPSMQTSSLLVHHRFELLTLGGLNRSELDEVYRRGVVVVDAYVPGLERVVQEAALFGAIPILSAAHNGVSLVDFPIPAQLLVDFSSGECVCGRVTLFLTSFRVLNNSHSSQQAGVH